MTPCGTVLNRIFGILVDSYISAVDGYRKKSDDQGKQGDVCLTYFSTLTLIIIMFLKLLLSSSLAHLLSKHQCVPHYHTILYFHYYFLQATKKSSTKPSLCPSTSFWDQVHMLAMQSQEILAEAYKNIVEKDFYNGGSKATAGLDLLLQRYVSSS